MGWHLFGIEEFFEYLPIGCDTAALGHSVWMSPKLFDLREWQRSN